MIGILHQVLQNPIMLLRVLKRFCCMYIMEHNCRLQATISLPNPFVYTDMNMLRIGVYFNIGLNGDVAISDNK